MNVRSRYACAAVTLLLGASAVVMGATTGAQARAPIASKSSRDPSARLFDTSVAHEVSIEIAPDNVRLLGISDTRIPADLTFDGRTLRDVGIRFKQGLGSYRPITGKSAFSIETDEFVDDQQLFGVERFTLGNSVWDPSFVSEQLAYSVFRTAGIPAPRTTYANVRVNGEHFGLYVLRETYDKRFLERNFRDPEGNLYEAPFGVDISDTSMELRTNESRNDKSDIEELAAVVRDAPDSKFLASAADLVDLREFFTYWAVETIVTHWDGYVSLSWAPFFNLDNPARNDNYRPNNYYVYWDPQRGKFVILPHGADLTFGNALWSESGAATRAWSPPKEGSLFAVRVYSIPGGHERLRNRMLWVLDTVWDPEALLRETDALAALVRANGLTAGREETTMAEFEAALALRRAFIVERAPAVRAELAAIPSS